MGEFNSDDHYIDYCGQESLRRNGVALIVNKKESEMQYLRAICFTQSTDSIINLIQKHPHRHGQK